jgi:hypothetical protein
MHCRKCDERDFPDNYKFCPLCGENLMADCPGEENCATPHEPHYGTLACLSCARRSLGFSDNYRVVSKTSENEKP